MDFRFIEISMLGEHSMIGEAIFMGLDPAIRRMREVMDDARREAFGG